MNEKPRMMVGLRASNSELAAKPQRRSLAALLQTLVLLVLIVLLAKMTATGGAPIRRMWLAWNSKSPPWKLAVLQIEDRASPMLERFIQHNASQSQLRGFEHILERQGPKELPPYWWKVFRMHELMDQRPDVDLFMWVDSDAFLVPDAADRVDRLVRADKRHAMWISPDAPKFNSPFCAGAFMVRNDARGRRLISEWANMFRRERWARNADGSGRLRPAHAAPREETRNRGPSVRCVQSGGLRRPRPGLHRRPSCRTVQGRAWPGVHRLAHVCRRRPARARQDPFGVPLGVAPNRESLLNFPGLDALPRGKQAS
jgi:hypothetical protein